MSMTQVSRQCEKNVWKVLQVKAEERASDPVETAAASVIVNTTYKRFWKILFSMFLKVSARLWMMETDEQLCN